MAYCVGGVAASWRCSRGSDASIKRRDRLYATPRGERGDSSVVEPDTHLIVAFYRRHVQVSKLTNENRASVFKALANDGLPKKKGGGDPQNWQT